MSLGGSGFADITSDKAELRLRLMNFLQYWLNGKTTITYYGVPIDILSWFEGQLATKTEKQIHDTLNILAGKPVS